MNSRVLFTCVGSTDPVRSLRDGAMLHIIGTIDLKSLYCLIKRNETAK